MSFRGTTIDSSGRRLAGSTALARNWWAITLRGAVAVLFGIVCFLEPGIALSSIVLVLGIYLLADGVFTIVAAFRAASHHERWALLLLEGLSDIVLGLVAVFVPIVAITVWVWLLAAWALVSGVLLVGAAFRLHRGHGGWLLGAAGIISVIWGALLALWPVSGAYILTLWLGAYALLFGIALVAFGIALRNRQGAVAAGP